MMLTPVDLLLVLATAAVCTAAITLLALLVLRRRRQRSVTAPFVVLVVAAIASIVCSTLVIAALMYLSLHDLQVLLWVVGLSAVLSLTATLLTARAVSRSFAHLGDAVERVGRGAVVSPEAYAARELADLSTQLAVASERLAAARAEIEQLDAARRQFFAWISHDLRTPLTGVSALAEALDDGAVADPAGAWRMLLVSRFTTTRVSSCGSARTVRPATPACSMPICFATASWCTSATASDTTSSSATSSRRSRSAPLWICDSSNRSSTSRFIVATCTRMRRT